MYVRVEANVRSATKASAAVGREEHAAMSERGQRGSGQHGRHATASPAGRRGKGLFLLLTLTLDRVSK